MTASELNEVGRSNKGAMMDELKRLQAEYWSAHESLATTGYTSQWEQMEAIARLSQLGLAVHEYGKAVSAMNRLACNL